MEFKKLNEFERLYLKWKDPDSYKRYKYRLRLQKTPAINIDHRFKEQTSFKHSGNIGDIIYSLPTIYALSKKGKALLHLKCDQQVKYSGKYHPLGSVMLTEKMVNMLKPLLLHQPQISLCDTFSSQHIDYDLDEIRSYPFIFESGSISRWYFLVFCVYANLSEPWLTAPKDESMANRIIIARSHRYRAPGIDYSFLKKYPNKLFIGIEEEYYDIKQYIPELEYLPVKDFLEMATIINSCRLFIGNQSFPFSLAEALKVPRALEVYYRAPNVIVEGANGYDFCYQPQFEKLVANLLNE